MPKILHSLRCHFDSCSLQSSNPASNTIHRVVDLFLTRPYGVLEKHRYERRDVRRSTFQTITEVNLFQFSESEKMKAIICSFPPLGQLTVFESTKITFTVALDVDQSRSRDPWEVVLWYSLNGENWQETRLESLGHHPEQYPVALQNSLKEDLSLSRLYFRSSLAVVETAQFTLKFRADADQSWKWAKDNQGTQDGTINVRGSKAYNLAVIDLEEAIGDLSPSIDYKKVSSQTPKTSVWSLKTTVNGARGASSLFTDVKLGKPWHGDFQKWFATVRIWSPWLCPRHGKDSFELDKDAILCSFLDKKGRHLVVLALSGIDDILTILQSDNDGNIILKIRNDREEEGIGRVIIAVGEDFELANAAAIYHARTVVSGYETMTGVQQMEVEAYHDNVDAQWIENWYDGLTYCTWNGLGQHLTEEKVYEAVETLAVNEINITNLIIDDNWQNLDYKGNGQFQHGWSTFEADPNTFPSGLKKVTSTIRSKHPSIQHIAVWHALWGYWGGIDPNGQIAKDYKTVTTTRVDGLRRDLPLGGDVTVVAKEDVARFYDDFYRFLSESGVDAVKTDAQFMFDTLESATARRDLFNTYLDAWTISSLKHFSIKAISCMSQTPQIIFHSQLPNNRPPIMVRNSDDFFPDVASSHTWHVWTNAHNALLGQYLNILPDWDMFQTVHDYSSFHAAARCVSGGPIYITDVPGEHDIDLINQMTGPTPRGKTVIFRPSVMGKTLDQYIDYDEEVLLKIGTYHGKS